VENQADWMLNDKERRRVAALIVNAARAGRTQAKRNSRHDPHERGSLITPAIIREQERRRNLTNHLAPLLAKLLPKAKPRAAFLSAAAAWGAAVVLTLSLLDVIR
jgi:hypothetical protein